MLHHGTLALSPARPPAYGKQQASAYGLVAALRSKAALPQALQESLGSCFYKVGSFFAGTLILRALLFEVYIGALKESLCPEPQPTFELHLFWGYQDPQSGARLCLSQSPDA